MSKEKELISNINTCFVHVYRDFPMIDKLIEDYFIKRLKQLEGTGLDNDDIQLFMTKEVYYLIGQLSGLCQSAGHDAIIFHSKRS